MMRLVWLGLGIGLLGGCASGLAVRQQELTHWVGQPEGDLLAAMGAPNRSYDSGAMKVLTYEETHIEQGPSGPYYFGPGPGAINGFSGRVYSSFCDTTFTITGGVVRAFSLRGDGCG
jgi:hypothetical protein